VAIKEFRGDHEQFQREADILKNIGKKNLKGFPSLIACGKTSGN